MFKAMNIPRICAVAVFIILLVTSFAFEGLLSRAVGPQIVGGIVALLTLVFVLSVMLNSGRPSASDYVIFISLVVLLLAFVLTSGPLGILHASILAMGPLLLMAAARARKFSESRSLVTAVVAVLWASNVVVLIHQFLGGVDVDSRVGLLTDTRASNTLSIFLIGFPVALMLQKPTVTRLLMLGVALSLAWISDAKLSLIAYLGFLITFTALSYLRSRQVSFSHLVMCGAATAASFLALSGAVTGVKAPSLQEFPQAFRPEPGELSALLTSPSIEPVDSRGSSGGENAGPRAPVALVDSLQSYLIGRGVGRAGSYTSLLLYEGKLPFASMDGQTSEAFRLTVLDTRQSKAWGGSLLSLNLRTLQSTVIEGGIVGLFALLSAYAVVVRHLNSLYGYPLALALTGAIGLFLLVSLFMEYTEVCLAIALILYLAPTKSELPSS